MPTITLIGQLSALSQRTDPLNHCSGSMEEENVALTEMEEDKIEPPTYSEKPVFDIQTKQPKRLADKVFQNHRPSSFT
jgi:hypothetical protein